MALPKGKVSEVKTAAKEAKAAETVTEEVAETAVEEEVAETAVEDVAEEVVSEQVEEEDAIPFEADTEYAQEEEPEPATREPNKAIGDASPPATRNDTRAVSTDVGGTTKVMHDLEEQGFEGLTTGFGTFPQVSLQNDGVFQSSEGWEMGSSFNCRLMGSRRKYIVKNTKCEQRDEDFVYTYDQATDANSGKPIQDTIDEWAERGWGYEVKPYLDVAAQLVGGDHDDEMVMLSIPKTSMGRFSGYAIRLEMKGKSPADVVTHIAVGDKVTKVDYPFYPWAFSLAK